MAKYLTPRQCVLCGRTRAIEARGLCQTCYGAARRLGTVSHYTKTGKEGARVVMLFCPLDAELGKRMYPGCPLFFRRRWFIDTLAAGYWPTGSVFKVSTVYLGPPAEWKVTGPWLDEVRGERVMVGFFENGGPRMELVETGEV